MGDLGQHSDTETAQALNSLRCCFHRKRGVVLGGKMRRVTAKVGKATVSSALDH